MLRQTISCLLLLLSLFALTACVKPASQMFYGWQVLESIPLMVNDGDWNTFDVDLQFHSERSGDTLSLTGQVMLTQHYHLLYNQVRDFNVYLFLVDDKMRIHKTVPLLGAAFVSTEFRRSFDVKTSIPQGVTAIAFGYRGHAYEWDSHAYFDQLPLRPVN